MSLCRLLAVSPQFARLSGSIACVPLPSLATSAYASSFAPLTSRITSKESITPLAVICKKDLSTTPRLDGKGGMLASVHWTMERVMAVVNLAVIPVAFALSHPFTDSLLALVTVIHTHWGLESIATDYLCRPLIMNKPISPIVGKVGIALVYLLSILTLAACIHFNYNDVGLTKAIKMFWAIN